MYIYRQKQAFLKNKIILKIISGSIEFKMLREKFTGYDILVFKIFLKLKKKTININNVPKVVH